MSKLIQLTQHLKAFDLVVIVFHTLLIIINLVFHSRVEYWLLLFFLNTGIILFAFIISYSASHSENKILKIIHYWYIAPVILFTFKQIYYMVKPIRQQDYDWLFIEIDRLMFGTDPTHFLYQFSHPLLTEILQIIYGMFYLLPILLALFLHMKNRHFALDYTAFLIIYGLYLSYIGYFALPGIGPRFTLHDFNSINEDLPGLFLTNLVREFVNSGESIPSGTHNPAEVVQRDIFPSGHTMTTLIVMYLSVKLKSRSRFFFIPVGSLLIFSTVYLWYHYVIDLVGGFLFMIFAVWSGKLIFNWWQRKRGKKEFDFKDV